MTWLFCGRRCTTTSSTPTGRCTVKTAWGCRESVGVGTCTGRMHRQTPLLLTMTAREGPVPSPLVALDEGGLLGIAGRTH